MKLLISSLLVSGSILSFAPIQHAGAQESNNNLMLVRDWIQRTQEEVSVSIQEDLRVSNSYTIRWGDTLYTIARAMRMSVTDLMELNNISNPDLIIAGHTLRLLGDRLVSDDSVLVEDNLVEIEDTLVENSEIFDEIISPETTSEETNYEELTSEEVTYEEITSPEVIEETTYEVVTEEETTDEPIVTQETTIETTTVEELTTYIEEYESEVPEYSEIWEEIVETIEEEPEDLAPSIFTDAREAFNYIVMEKGLTASEIEGWSYIIDRESGWNVTIANPYSGAYGLPQALPGNKMASHGADWETNPYTQLSWMYDYMVNRYGSIQGAVDFWNANHWY